MLVPTVEQGEGARNRMLEADEAEAILDYLEKYDYASKRHALLTVLWHTGCRM